ncbi:alpha-mannosidase [Candidatus Arthromitus sp. SFB-rat-Yit]|uniref:alpha-mannosidase n=1 Tax=Candidatus Arthromitus sp. SFB-rat-Yit TaxID=1041504 RepID=UPI000227A078|nr:alpha-mannosidase [Candidatus Arthromitus sp. SFB-rat-Yit]BAK81219.1 alpha-mannosidase [Candidatus Arthromitus sp. SFB-rat-Yit]
MTYLLERIDKICREIQKHIYKNIINIDTFMYVDGNYHNIDLIKEVSEDKWVEFKSGDLWGGRDCHGWFKFSVTVPENFNGQTIALNLSTFDEGWDATNPQFIIYINGEHIQGVDINHREIILTHNAVAGEKYDIDLHAYAGMLSDKKATLNGKFVVIDMNARELYWNLKVPIDVCKELDKEDKNRIDMITVLNDAINIIDLRKPYSKEYNESIKKTNEFLEDKFYGELCGHEDVIATCVGHTHIDVAWLWTVAQTREKVARSFSTVLKLMEEYPEYVFMSSQPQLYKMLKEDHPKVYEKVKDKIKQGVWEPEGAMWVESDCNVTSGESLVRQIVHGKRFFKEEFGVDNKILWLPDVFGYSAAIPQILKKSGIKYFMTTKISWNQFNKIPNDTFMWQGIDGSEILTYFITTSGPGQNRDSFFTTYNGHIQPDAIMGSWRRFQNKNLTNDVLISFGWGDGGGGATLEMLENGRRLSRGIPGAPRVKMGTSLDFFENLENKISKHKKLPKWVGELYLEYHRGTYTSMARNKRDNRKCENLYLSLEKLSSLSMILGGNYDQQEINNSWETILLNQFHDIIPGSSIKDVYDVTQIEYRELLDKVNKSIDNTINDISDKVNLKDQSVIVFNTLGFDRDDIVEFDVPNNIKHPLLIDENGDKVVCQLIGDSKAIFFGKNIPANGYKTFKIVEASDVKIKTDLTLTNDLAENKFFKIKFDDKGQIISLINKLQNREILKDGCIGNQLQAFEDKPMCFDNWDIDIYYKEKMWLIDDVQNIEITENGPVRSTLKIKRKFLDSTIIQNVHIYNDIERIDFETYVDWKESDVLVKVLFPVDINTKEATYEIQYGNVTRPTHNNTSWELAAFEVCGHKWADLSEGDFGVSLLNDSKYGHDIKNGNIRLTLLKSTCDPNPDADKEEHFFTYSIYSHDKTWKESKTVQLAHNLNTKLFAKVCDPHDGELDINLSLAKVNKENIIIEVIKKAEDSEHLIIRLYEFHNKRTNASLKLAKNIKDVYECDLLENNLETIVPNKDTFEFEIKPFEIKTFKVKL